MEQKQARQKRKNEVSSDLVSGIGPPPKSSASLVDSWDYKMKPKKDFLIATTPTKKLKRKSTKATLGRIWVPAKSNTNIVLSACGRSCNHCCGSVDIKQRQQYREQLKQVYHKDGVAGERLFLSQLCHPAAINNSSMRKRGWIKGMSKKNAGMKCVWCKTLSPSKIPKLNHSFNCCPHKADAENAFTARKGQATMNPARLVYQLPAPQGSLEQRVRVCKRTFCNVFGPGMNSKKLKAILHKERETILPKLGARGRELGWNSSVLNKFEMHLKKYPRTTGTQ